ncbi:hypothetical protein SAMN05443663_103194 [Flavobacterium defluvii]|uniref:Uncharacterized protein n=1 Tax=Flavobacterium defluvii TaxID=370979 RepID=A0A1M5KVG9_9FLAO|nr:hypothetical protein SAMN05443663_103194 [Flavobacterium defluvii]
MSYEGYLNILSKLFLHPIFKIKKNDRNIWFSNS